MRVAGNRIAFFRPQIAKVKVVPPPLRPNARRAVVDVAGFEAARHVRPGRAVPVPARAKSLVVQTGQSRLRHADRLEPAAHGRALVHAQRHVAVPGRKLAAGATRTPRLRSAQRQHAHVVQPRHAQRVQKQRAVRTMHASRPMKMRAAPQRMPRMQRQVGRPSPGRHRH